MTPLIAKIMTFGAIGSVIAVLAMSAGRTVLGAELTNSLCNIAVSPDRLQQRMSFAVMSRASAAHE